MPLHYSVTKIEVDEDRQKEFVALYAGPDKDHAFSFRSKYDNESIAIHVWAGKTCIQEYEFERRSWKLVTDHVQSIKERIERTRRELEDDELILLEIENLLGKN